MRLGFFADDEIWIPMTCMEGGQKKRFECQDGALGGTLDELCVSLVFRLSLWRVVLLRTGGRFAGRGMGLLKYWDY